MIIILAAGVVILAVYVVLQRQQIHKINRQLEKRREENTRQPISLELMDSGLIRLAGNINQCLKNEEKLKEHSLKKEKEQKEMIAELTQEQPTKLTAIK